MTLSQKKSKLRACPEWKKALSQQILGERGAPAYSAPRSRDTRHGAHPSQQKTEQKHQQRDFWGLPTSKVRKTSLPTAAKELFLHVLFNPSQCHVSCKVISCDLGVLLLHRARVQAGV